MLEIYVGSFIHSFIFFFIFCSCCKSDRHLGLIINSGQSIIARMNWLNNMKSISVCVWLWLWCVGHCPYLYNHVVRLFVFLHLPLRRPLVMLFTFFLFRFFFFGWMSHFAISISDNSNQKMFPFFVSSSIRFITRFNPNDNGRVYSMCGWFIVKIHISSEENLDFFFSLLLCLSVWSMRCDFTLAKYSRVKTEWQRTTIS